MKRLNLKDFKTKTLTKNTKEATDKLLGQVLGDCHDEPKTTGGTGVGNGRGLSF